MSLPEVGLQAVIANLPGFDAGAKSIVNAYDAIEKKAGNVEKATSILGKTFSSFTSPVAALGGQFVGLGDSLLKVGMIAGGTALAGITALGVGLTTFAVTGIQKATDLDAQMATIAATMNTTKDAVGPLKDLILDLALDPNLTVTTTQAADAIQQLAQNGVTMSQIMDGAAASTVALANATGAQFSTAATVASGVMQVFGIDAKNMGQAIDGITGVTNQSKFTIDDYASAFAQAGGIAASMGVTFEDFNTVITASANNFSSGSDAGTSFKTMLQRLANPTDEAKATMQRYGISLFDAEGKMRPLSEVAQQLNNVFQGSVSVTETLGGATKKEAQAAENAAQNIGSLTAKIATNEKQLQLYNDQLALEIGYYGEGSPKVRQRQLQIEKLTNTINDQKLKLGEYEGAIALVEGAQAQQVTTVKTLTEAEKAELAAVIGGADAARSVLALSQLTSDQFSTLSDNVNDTGQAFRAAATRVDSFKGAMDIFGGIIEAIQIQVGDKFLPLLRQMAITFSELASQYGPKVVSFFGGVATAIGGLISRAPGLLNLFGKNGIAGLFASMGFEGSALFLKKISELFRLITGDAGTLGMTIQTVLGAAFTWLTTNLFPMLSTGIQFIIDHFEEFKGALFGVGAVLAGGVFAALVAGILGLLTPINLIIAGAALLGAAWAGNWGGIQEKTFAAWAVIQPVLGQLASWLQTNIPVAVQALSDIWNNTLLPGFQRVWTAIEVNILPLLMQLGNWLMSQGPGASSVLADAWNNVILPALLAVGDFVLNTLFPLWVELQVWLAENIPVAIQTLSDFWNNILLPAITGIWDFLSTSLFPLFRSISDFMSAVLGKAVEALAGLWQNILLPALEDVWAFISEQLNPVFETIGAKIDEKVKPSISTLSEKILPALKKGLEAVKKVIQDVTSFFEGLANKVKGFQLPEILQQHSPSPFEQALIDIGIAANTAGEAFSNMTNQINISPALIDQLLGVNRNIADIHSAVGAARDDLEKFFDAEELDGAKTDFALSTISQIFHQHADEILGAGNKIEKFNEIASAMGINWQKAGFGGTSGKILERGIGVFLSQIEYHKDRLEKAEQQMYLQAGRTAIGIGKRLIDIVDSAAEYLDSRVETLKSIQEKFASGEQAKLSELSTALQKNIDKQQKLHASIEKTEGQIFDLTRAYGENSEIVKNAKTFLSGLESELALTKDQTEELNKQLVALGIAPIEFEGKTINALQAQEMLNKALADQKRTQEEILKLRENEQKLGFLEKQLDLMQTLSQAGINVNDILGGLTLGLNASIPDMVAATNKLIEAMINQVNADLQISSPSKVMFEKGKQTGQGFVGGMLNQIPDIVGAIKGIVTAPTLVNAPALGAGIGGSVTNVYNMGGNNINNGMDESQFEAKVLQAIRKNLR